MTLTRVSELQDPEEQEYDFPEEWFYPQGDGKPMAETPIHGLNLSTSVAVLQEWLADRPDKFVAGNICLYYVKGDPYTYVSPDVFVVLGVPDRERMSYYTWKEPKPTLDFVIEFTSKSSRKADKTHKFLLYRDVLRVREYVLFDPLARKSGQVLYRLEGGEYREVTPVDGRLPSEVLNLHLERHDRMLRFWNPATGQLLKTASERAAEEAQRAELERRRADRESKLAKQERRLAEQERKRAEEERKRAERAEAQIDAERRRADEAARELARLQAELEALRRRSRD